MSFSAPPPTYLVTRPYDHPPSLATTLNFSGKILISGSSGSMTCSLI